MAVLTQGVLLLNQIVLLPIQIRVWGTEGAAYWYSVMAVAAVTTAADFGLRTAGHAEIVSHARDRQAGTEFQHLWAWIRILVFTITFFLVVVDFLWNEFHSGTPYPLWRPALLIAIALEMILTVRVGYLDSLGLYREAEGGYLQMAAAKLVLSVGALVIFQAPPVTLAWIWFLTGFFAIAQQSRLCSRLKLLRIFEPIPPGLSIRTLATVRYTMADPCSGWVRINGPVVVLTLIAQPVVIVTYVAMRAVFGAARTTILQLSRYASVEYLALRQARKFEQAEVHVTLSVLVAAFFASGVAGFVIADNGRLASLLLHKMDFQYYQEIAITFGLGGAYYSYQILQAVSRRSGEVERVAHRQYAYMACSVVFAGIALVAKSTLLWLLLMLTSDIMISLLVMLTGPGGGILSHTAAGRRGTAAATASFVILLAMWLVVHFENFDFLRAWTVSAFTCTAGFYVPWIVLIGLVNVCLAYGLPIRKADLATPLTEADPAASAELK